MEAYKIKKSMIAAAVEKALRDAQEDPQRVVRRLADLGRHFSNNPFQKFAFPIIQELLENEDSAYYRMTSTVLNTCDHESLKTFGLNIGYMSWAHGARKIRENKDANGDLPWCVFLRYDPARSDGLTVPRVRPIIAEGQRLGIYTYFIRQTSGSAEAELPVDLFVENPDAAFIWLCPDSRLTAAQIEKLSACKNLLLVLPAADPDAIPAAKLLHSKKLLCAMYVTYGDEGLHAIPAEKLYRAATEADVALLYTVAQDGTDCDGESFCYGERLRQNSPCLVLDYYGDAAAIGNITVENRRILEIGEDGHIIPHRGDSSAPSDRKSAFTAQDDRDFLSGFIRDPLLAGALSM